MTAIIDTFDSTIDTSLAWLIDEGAGFFNAMSTAMDSAYGAINTLLMFAPWWAVVLVVALIGWRVVGLLFAATAVAGLWLCQAMGLWTETMATLTLVFSSTLLALLIAIPAGVVVGLSARWKHGAELVLDFIQTMPPYIFLLPGIALLGYGPATAIWATCLVAIPPALRLTAHGVFMTPVQYCELGSAVGMKTASQVMKIRLPFAIPSILAGINQSLMLSFGMVVIAGIAGSGGLGQTIYEAVRTLKIDLAVNAGIAIVILTIVLDRISQAMCTTEKGAA
ncbi:ABC transporter permease subunit [Pantoea sp. Tr-811]|uniref:ABC transporter permease n=1 Tax=Pantoea sp. Tr-811 TaxID=2608361 RepID=UPI0014201AD1|nr:ABC transporter permease subunit [Pantoea sp. Tr-811]NIF29757.1 ABC transporter permease subunit [Pantoea sp. Tr-811]